MQTELITVDAAEPESDRIARAAAVLRRGGLVAFPTETVYGLGAAALDPAAVGKIFEAKGRPSNNPLIVHVTTLARARSLATSWPKAADDLAARFWPGPLTFVLPKSTEVPSIVTAGGATVAVRMPAHPVARALIEAAGVPLAAPSANRSTQVSAVRAEHVQRALAGRIDMIVDGGPAWDGLESTVVDLTADIVRILRPGPIDARMLGEVLGYEPKIHHAQATEADSSLASPGLLRKHYSPSAAVVLTKDDGREAAIAAVRLGRRVGWLPMTGGEPTSDELQSDVRSNGDSPSTESSGIVRYPMPREPAAYGRKLYDVFHQLEVAGVETIIIEAPPTTTAWAAVLDRLTRAAAT